jgi:hypothetical protein
MADGKKAYIPESGMTAAHFKAVQEVAQLQQVIAIVRNTNTASTPLIEKGCPSKPQTVKAKTDARTGVVTAGNPKEIEQAYKAGYFVIDADGVARREVVEGGKPTKQELKIDAPFWSVAQGQIIDPEVKKPLVGDYDIQAVFSPKNPGQNIALVAKDGVKVSNIESPIVRNFRSTVNQKLDRARMLHGAQDQFAGFAGGATVFMPDGTVRLLEGEGKVKAFYESIGRQTIQGKYVSGPPGSGEPIPVIPGARRMGTGVQGVLQNHDVMAMLGQLLGAGLQWLGDIGIQRNVENQLKTTYARAIADHFSRGNGVLVIIHMQEWAQEDFNGMRGRALLGVSIEGGLNQKAALANWRSQPRLLQGAADGWRAYDQYVWIDPPR